MAVEVVTPEDFLGDIIGDLNSRRGRIEGMEPAQGGTQVVAKRLGNVALNFLPGSQRAQTSGQATIQVHRGAATLPEDVRRELTRERKSTDADAAIDPLANPTIRDAVAKATFEHLVGFQLTQEQLRYNATR